MTANYLHGALEIESVPFTKTFDPKEQKRVRTHNTDCEAFWTRINHVILN